MTQHAVQYETAGRGYRIRLETVLSGFAPEQGECWVHARAGAIPGDPPAVVMTMQRLDLGGSDVFGPLHDLRTDDGGGVWSEPREHRETLGRRSGSDGLQIGICDFTPAWHEATGTLLGTGHSVAYGEGERGPRPHNRKTLYSVYDPVGRVWSPWDSVDLPPELGNAGAGCTQRVDLENGDILLPVYGKKPECPYFFSTVLKCGFDGRRLRYLTHGSELTLPDGRGYYEPSLTRFNGRFYLTLRADDHGAVAAGDDGLHFAEARPWTWDDGTRVPTYNTQQHWVIRGDRLFLVYTRDAGHNGHVFRHRAPLFMAEVDPERLCLIRDTEIIVVPERGARLGNFGVVDVGEKETWITVCEWMQNSGPWGEEMWRKLAAVYPDDELEPLRRFPHMSAAVAKYGADNAVYVARILWD